MNKEGNPNLSTHIQVNNTEYKNYFQKLIGTRKRSLEKVGRFKT